MPVCHLRNKVSIVSELQKYVSQVLTYCAAVYLKLRIPSHNLNPKFNHQLYFCRGKRLHHFFGLLCYFLSY